MKKILERIVASESAPGHYDLWVDTNKETPELKVNYGYDKNSGWKTIGSSSGGGSDSGSGCSCLAPMVVEGTFEYDTDTLIFTPADGSPTYAEARAHMNAGGLVYMLELYEGEPDRTYLATHASFYQIQAYGYTPAIWSNPDDV